MHTYVFRLFYHIDSIFKIYYKKRLNIIINVQLKNCQSGSARYLVAKAKFAALGACRQNGGPIQSAHVLHVHLPSRIKPNFLFTAFNAAKGLFLFTAFNAAKGFYLVYSI